MALCENIKNGVEFVGETITEIAASIAEKNRLRVQLNHIKALIKTDSATRDQAYIELGRFFYENLREDAAPENEALCVVIDSANERISNASVKYLELLNLQNETKIRSENAEKLKKAVAEKAAASAKAAKEKGAELSQKAKDAAADAVSKAKVTAADLKGRAVETVSGVKERFNPERDAQVDAIIAEEQQKTQQAQDTEAETQPAETPAVNEESPDSFDF